MFPATSSADAQDRGVVDRDRRVALLRAQQPEESLGGVPTVEVVGEAGGEVRAHCVVAVFGPHRGDAGREVVEHGVPAGNVAVEAGRIEPVGMVVDRRDRPALRARVARARSGAPDRRAPRGRWSPSTFTTIPHSAAQMRQKLSCSVTIDRSLYRHCRDSGRSLPAHGSPGARRRILRACPSPASTTPRSPPPTPCASSTFYKALGFGIDGEEALARRQMPIFSITFGNNKINVHSEACSRCGASPWFLRGPTAEPGCGDFCFVWEGGSTRCSRCSRRRASSAIEGPVPRIGGRDAGTGQGISVYTRDPDDNLLEFISYDADDVARYSGSPAERPFEACPRCKRLHEVLGEAAHAHERVRLELEAVAGLGHHDHELRAHLPRGDRDLELVV